MENVPPWYFLFAKKSVSMYKDRISLFSSIHNALETEQVFFSENRERNTISCLRLVFYFFFPFYNSEYFFKVFFWNWNELPFLFRSQVKATFHLFGFHNTFLTFGAHFVLLQTETFNGTFCHSLFYRDMLFFNLVFSLTVFFMVEWFFMQRLLELGFDFGRSRFFLERRYSDIIFCEGTAWMNMVELLFPCWRAASLNGIIFVMLHQYN